MHGEQVSRTLHRRGESRTHRHQRNSNRLNPIRFTTTTTTSPRRGPRHQDHHGPAHHTERGRTHTSFITTAYDADILIHSDGQHELPPRGVPVAGPLQHQTTALPMPPFQPRKLRKDPHDRYAARSRLTTNPVSTTWGQGPTSPLRSVHLSQPRSASGYSPMQLINQIPLNQEWTN